MYFIPRGSRLYQWAGAVRPYIRYMLTIIILILFIMVWWYGLYSVTRAKILQKRAAITVLQKKGADIQKARKDIVDLEATVQALQEKKDSFTVVQAEQELLSYILSAAAGSGVTLTGYTTQGYIEKSWYKNVVIQLDFDGTSDQINALFMMLEKSKKMIQCNRLNCSSSTQNHYATTAYISMTIPFKAV
jgi:Tfp pilus assembly protein PilO